jgi:hypothetical protein
MVVVSSSLLYKGCESLQIDLALRATEIAVAYAHIPIRYI